MRKLLSCAALALFLGGCLSTNIPHDLNATATPLGKPLPPVPRQQIATLIEGAESSKGVATTKSTQISSAELGLVVRTEKDKELVYYCVNATLKQLGFPISRWWVVYSPIQDLPPGPPGTPTPVLLTIAGWRDEIPPDCPPLKMEPLPELVAAREARRAGETASVIAPPKLSR